jgi:hypothetical protein
MKTKPKKLAAVLEMDRQELKYLLWSLSQRRLEVSRDYNAEEQHDKLKIKIEAALNSME